MLGKMKIRCINELKGCKEVLKVDNLDLHEKCCHFNKPICVKCKCHMDSDHDCIESLLESNRKLIESSNKLKLENGNYLKIVQHLSSIKSNSSSQNPSEVVKSQRYI